MANSVEMGNAYNVLKCIAAHDRMNGTERLSTKAGYSEAPMKPPKPYNYKVRGDQHVTGVNNTGGTGRVRDILEDTNCRMDTHHTLRRQEPVHRRCRDMGTDMSFVSKAKPSEACPPEASCEVDSGSSWESDCAATEAALEAETEAAIEALLCEPSLQPGAAQQRPSSTTSELTTYKPRMTDTAFGTAHSRSASQPDGLLYDKDQLKPSRSAIFKTAVLGEFRQSYSSKMYTIYSMPHTYTDMSSTRALKQANDLLARHPLPGLVRFMPVSEGSPMFDIGTLWGFSAYAIALGSSYFQRLANSIPQIAWAVCSSRKFACYLPYIRQELRQENMGFTTSEDITLSSIVFTCIYLATKVVDRVPCAKMLTYILSKLYGARISDAQAYEIESKCLDGLAWRLGPYFLRDQLDEHWVV